METKSKDILMITPEFARSILETKRYPGQRPLSGEYVNFLVREMQRSAFLQGTTIVFCEGPGGDYLLDGYTRMTAVVKSGLAQEFTTVTYTVMNDEETVLIYERLDQGRKRSIMDTLTASGILQKTELDKTNLRRLGATVRWLASGFDSRAKRIPLDRHKEYIEEWAPYYKQYLSFLVDMPDYIRRRFLNSTVTSVALVTLRYAGEQAVEFWQGAARDDGLTLGDPRKALINFINRFSTGRTSDNREYMTSLLFLKHVAHIWNAYYENRVFTRVKKMSRMGPTEIMGTPYEVGSKNV